MCERNTAHTAMLKQALNEAQGLQYTTVHQSYDKKKKKADILRFMLHYMLMSLRRL